MDERVSDWQLQAIQNGKTLFYCCHLQTGISERSENSMALVGLPSTGPSQNWVECIVPEDRPYFEDALHRVTQESPRFEIKYRIRHAVNGHRFWVQDRGSGIFDQQGTQIGVSGAIVDISSIVNAETDVRESARLHTFAAEAARMGVWHLDLVMNCMTVSDELLALLELSRKQFDGAVDTIDKLVHPDDLEGWRLARQKAMTPGGNLEFELRLLLPQKKIRWFLIRGDITYHPNGVALECYGVMIDITERKDWETHQTMLLRELSHRVTNTLTVIQSIMRQTLRSKNDPSAFAEAFEGRIYSLAASHALLTATEWRGGRLVEIIKTQLGGIVGDLSSRCILTGPDVILPAETATQLGLVLHELGTNAAKYGALSISTGKVHISWTTLPEKLILDWHEQGGPPIDNPPERNGFGTSLIAASVADFTREFIIDGLKCRLELVL